MLKLIKQKHIRLYKKYTTQVIRDLDDKSAILFFEDIASQCGNCVYDMVHKTSSNKYNGTGPKPFTGGICPSCKGCGTVKIPKSSPIQCTVNWGNIGRGDTRQSTPSGNSNPGFFKIKTLVKDYDKLNTAKYK